MYVRDVRKDGTCGIYLQVIINRKKVDIGLDLHWPPGKFIENGGCKPRYKNDAEVADYNLIIGNARTKSNEILLFYRVRDLPIDIDIFKREYLSNMNKSNFIEYMRQKSFDRWSKGIISDSTYAQEKTTIVKLTAFSSIIPFNSFHAQWGQEFDLFLRKAPYNNGQNTLWSEKKRVKTYLSMATNDGIAYIDPYKKFKVPQKKSRFKALSKNQFKKLWEFYQSSDIEPEQKVILRRFLFSCCTGLRIGDLRMLTVDNFKNGKMTLDPKKTKKYGTHIDSVPLNEMAMQLLAEEIKVAGNKLFFKYTEQYGNRMLKKIALHEKVAIDHSIHNHIGRSTFASLYDQAGGNHRSLMEYMGLTKMDTLMKYVQTNKEVIAEGIDKMNEALK